MDLQTEKLWIQTPRQNQTNGGITLVLEPVNDTFLPKRLPLVEGSSVRIGRMTNKGTTPTDSNGYFDSKVLSRNHAEVIYRNGQVFIRDLKSSNGTFINGKRLSAEGKESSPVELKHGDDLEFGVDIVNEQDKKLLFRKVAAKVCLSQAGGEIYDSGITGIEHQKAITNGHISVKRRSRMLPNTENSLLAMLEAELDRARVESRYLSELGSMLNDATNTLDSRSKRMPSDKSIDLRFYEESHFKLEEAQNKLRETEAKLHDAICAQKEYKDRFMASDRQVIELKEKYTSSEKKVNELEQKCTSSEKKISELEQNCIQLEQKCKESDQKVVGLEDKCKDSELRIKMLEDALQSTVKTQTKSSQFEDLEERLIKITNELSDNKFFLDDTREQLKRAEKELHSSQKKCREFQIYASKYNDAMKTIEELRSCEASFGNRIEMRDEAIEKFDEERIILLSRIHFLEEAAKKNDNESVILRDQLRRVELLNKSLMDEADRTRSREGLLPRRRHRKQESEPIKEGEMTGGGSVMTESINLYDKKSNKKYTKSLFIKGSIGVVVLGIGAWCFSKLYP